MDHFIEYENVPIEEICRLCISERKSVEIFSSFNCNSPKYSEVASSLCEIDIMESESDDEFPSGICSECASKLMQYYEFKIRIKKSYSDLINLIKDGIASKIQSTNIQLQNEQIEELENEKDRSIHLKIIKTESYLKKQSLSHENNLEQFDTIYSDQYYDENNEMNTVEIFGLDTTENPIKDELDSSQCNDESEQSDLNQDDDVYEMKYNSKSSTSSINKLKRKIQKSNIVNKCNICEKIYKSKHTLKSHMYVHTGELNFECTECGRKFGQQKLLKAHMEVKHIKSKFYYCDTCGRQFNRKNNLLKHQWVHKDGGRFSCQHCGKLFKWENSLKAHQTTHTDERPHECEVCNKNFKAYSSLKKHCIKLHDGYGCKILKTK